MPTQGFQNLPTWSQVQLDPLLGSAVTTAIDARVQESVMRLTAWNLIETVPNNFFLFLNGYRQAGTRHRYRMNQIQLVCIANAAIQAGDRPTIKITPRESGEKPVCFINTQLSLPTTANDPNSLVGGLLQGLRPETMNPAPGTMPVPLNDNETALVKHIMDISDAQRIQAMVSGLPEPMDALPKNFLVEVDDFMVAEASQTILDIKADQANLSQYLVENILYNNIFGYQFLLCEHDDEEKRFYFKNPEFLTVHVDPFKTDIRDCQYAVFDEFLGADEACLLYPELSAKIEANATQGPPAVPGYVPYRVPLPWFQAYMGRLVVIVRNVWLRNQPFPMTPEEAIKKGKIVMHPVPDEMAQISNQSPEITEDDPGFLDTIVNKVKGFFGAGNDTSTGATSSRNGGEGDRNPDGENALSGSSSSNGSKDSVDGGRDSIDTDAKSDSGESDESGGGESSGEHNGGTDGTKEKDPQGGSLSASPVANGISGPGSGATPGTVNVPLREAYFLVGSDGQPDFDTGEIDVNSPQWPIRRGLREIRIIANALVSDRESERSNIPLGHNVNIPIMFTPFGQGEPERLEPLQRAYNATLSDMIEHGNSVAFPPKVALKSVLKENPELVKNGFRNPDKIYGVDDKQAVAMGGLKNAVAYVEPPNLPGDIWKREQVLYERFQTESDQSDVLRGDTPTANASGQLVANLQSAAKSSIQFKASRSEDMIKYIYRLMLTDIARRYSPEDLADEVREYPIQVWYEIHRRLQQHCIECDISVKIVGRDAQNAQQTNAMMQARSNGLPVSDASLFDRLDLDPAVEEQNNMKAARSQALTAQMVAPQANPNAQMNAAQQPAASPAA